MKVTGKKDQTSTSEASSSNGTSLSDPPGITQPSRPCLISIWSTWYAILVLVLHVYLTTIRVHQILDLAKVSQNQNIKEKTELIARSSLLAVSSFFLLLFCVTSLKKCGNFANDGVKFGRDFFDEKLLHKNRRLEFSDVKKNSVFISLYRHFLPFNSLCHFLAALFLLFSELVFPSSTTQFFQSTLNSSRIIETLLPYSSTFLSTQILTFRLEILSIAFALLSLFVRYASVFWFTNKFLALLISLIGLIASVQQLLQLYAFAFFYQQLDTRFFGSWKWSVIDSASNQLPLLIISQPVLLFLHSTLSVLVCLSATPAYVFAFLKYKERLMSEEILFSQKISLTSKETIMSTCCFNYCPHLIATVQLVLMCACKLPFCYDSVVYFNLQPDFGLMLVIIGEIMHTIVLIFIWLLLTLKTDWNMHLQPVFSVCHWTLHSRLNEKRPPVVVLSDNVKPAVAPVQMISHYQDLPLQKQPLPSKQNSTQGK